MPWETRFSKDNLFDFTIYNNVMLYNILSLIKMFSDVNYQEHKGE